MKKYLLALILVFAIIFTIKFFFSAYFMPTTSGYHGYTSENKVDYLFLGSSQTRQGLNPAILEDSLGSIYLMAYNANSFYYIDFLLGMMQKKNQLPKKLIIEAYPIRAYLKMEASDSRLFNELDYAYKIKYLQISKKVLSCWDTYDLLTLRGNEGIIAYPFIRGLMNSLSYKGGYLNKFVTGTTPEKFAAIKSPVKDSIVYRGLDTNQVAALKRIFLFSKTYNIDINFLEPPVAKNIKESSIFIRAQDDLKKQIVQSGYKYIGPGDYTLDANNPELFNDGVHLSSVGRDAYTKSVISYIR